MSEQNPSLQNAIRECRGMMKKGSKSFSMASLLFGKEKQQAAFLLYGWCRYCDDEIDSAFQTDGVSELEMRLGRLKEQTLAACKGEKINHPVFVAFQHVVLTYKIPWEYPLSLLEGMAMDVRKQRYQTFSDLTLYCYRVAGVVGLMMSHVMQISDEKSLKHAADLGIAMQITNICRDVKEDAARGRLYLPLDWVQEFGLSASNVLEGEKRLQLVSLVQKMLDRAELYYRSGDAGLRYLPFRSACAVSAAREVYCEIGRKVWRLGAVAIENRVWISKFQKIILLGKGIGKAIGMWTKQVRWRPVEIESVWRHV